MSGDILGSGTPTVPIVVQTPSLPSERDLGMPEREFRVWLQLLLLLSPWSHFQLLASPLDVMMRDELLRTHHQVERPL